MIRLANCGIAGPGLNLNCGLIPYVLANAFSIARTPSIPPIVPVPQLSVRLPSFLAPSMSCGRVCEKTDPGASINPTTRNKNKHNMRISLLNISLLTLSYCDLLERLEGFERLEHLNYSSICFPSPRRTASSYNQV